MRLAVERGNFASLSAPWGRRGSGSGGESVAEPPRVPSSPRPSPNGRKGRAKCGRLAAAAVATLLAAFAAAGAGAVEPNEMLKDPALEARAQIIGESLRCLVCQNQSIEDSGADLAHDLRVLVRQRVTAGDSNDQVIAFVVARYGDFVLLDPPFKPATWALWLASPAVLLLGVAGLAVWFRRRSRLAAAPPPLSADEERRIAALIDREAGS